MQLHGGTLAGIAKATASVQDDDPSRPWREWVNVRTCPDANRFAKGADSKASAQDEIDDLREKLQRAQDRIAVLELTRKPDRPTPPLGSQDFDAEMPR